MKKPLILFSISIALLSACSEDIITSDHASNNAIPVETSTIEKTTFKKSIELVGKTVPSEQVPVVSSVPSPIKEIHIKEGDTVKSGDLLFSLEDQEIRQQLEQARSATAALEQSRSQLNTAIEQQRATQARVNTVIDETIGQLEDIQVPEEAESNDITANITETLEQLKGLASSGSSLTSSTLPLIDGQLQQARNGVREAEKALEATKITAPIDGMIDQVNAQVGAPAVPSSPLAIVSSKQDLKAVFSANKFQVEELDEDMQVKLTFDDTSDSLTGTIESISTETNPETNTYTVSVALEDNDGSIEAGSMASATIDTLVKENAVTVPNRAILYDQNKPYVYIVRDEHAIKQTIELATEGENSSYVSRGLSEGDVVITEGKYQLINRSKISIKK